MKLPLVRSFFVPPPPSSGKPVTKLLHFDRASFASVVFNRSFTTMTLHTNIKYLCFTDQC